MKFQIPSMHHSEVLEKMTNRCTHSHTHRQTDRQTDKPKAICPSNFFKVEKTTGHVTSVMVLFLDTRSIVYFFTLGEDSYKLP